METEKTVLGIAMKHTFDFLEEESGLPNEFNDNIVVVPLDYALDIIKDMADTINKLMKKLKK